MEPDMFPLLCEITLASVISYQFAMLVLQNEKSTGISKPGVKPQQARAHEGFKRKVTIDE
jgi:hypothetical protein